MSKLVFAIFAHPDDESFGPSGTLLMEARSGAKVHLISLTAGESGVNPGNHPDLKAIRLNEWNDAGQLIGASGLHYLEFADGLLNNADMQTASEAISKIVGREYAKHDNPTVEFITNDLNGITGHIDHIVAGRAACLSFYRLKDAGLNMAKIRLACLSRDEVPNINTDWLYMERGRTGSEVDETVDATEHHDTILQIIRAHKSQRNDGEMHIRRRGDKLGLDHFLVLK
jgi:LmbE family N-acetylglucosaminyl deacetylase